MRLCQGPTYLPKLKDEADNTNVRFDIPLQFAKTEFTKSVSCKLIGHFSRDVIGCKTQVAYCGSD